MSQKRESLVGGSGRGSTIWTCATLWSVILVGEWGWVSQSTLSIIVWAATFTLPLLFTKCQAASDAFVDEACAFLLSALHGGEKLPSSNCYV